MKILMLDFEQRHLWVMGCKVLMKVYVQQRKNPWTYSRKEYQGHKVSCPDGHRGLYLCSLSLSNLHLCNFRWDN